MRIIHHNINDLAKTMDPEIDKPLNIKTNSQKKSDLSGLSNEELLNQLANSPCANKKHPESQSLEEYLRTSQANLARQSPP